MEKIKRINESLALKYLLTIVLVCANFLQLNKSALLETANLTKYHDGEFILKQMGASLTKAYQTVNNRFKNNENKYIFKYFNKQTQIQKIIFLQNNDTFFSIN